jgi:hypothetical protein
MKFTHKPYQADAVSAMLGALERAKNVYQRERRPDVRVPVRDDRCREDGDGRRR